jgi:hypothetical protein
LRVGRKRTNTARLTNDPPPRIDFYQLVASPRAAELKLAAVGGAASFGFLASSGCVAVAGVDDHADFADVDSAFRQASHRHV